MQIGKTIYCVQSYDLTELCNNADVLQTKVFSSWISFLAWKEETETYIICFVQPNGEIARCEEKTAVFALRIMYNNIGPSRSVLQR